jgi:meso-butanediol dehydrogenase/(S,S)-butanediol dehydrogenase/diacetyl reductase
MARFAGKTVVVTGSGRHKGLGQGILQRFADEGANCVVSDVVIDAQAKEVAAELRGRGAKVATLACDVSDAAQCDALVAGAVAEFGSVDVLVNNAGIGFMMKPMLEVDPADWARVIAVNLSGAFYCTQAAGKAMIAAGKGGRIINIASQAAKSAFPHLPAYVSSKHGMIGLTRATALELGGHGITVNAVCPNHVTTALGAEQNTYFSKLLGFATVEAQRHRRALHLAGQRRGFLHDRRVAEYFGR